MRCKFNQAETEERLIEQLIIGTNHDAAAKRTVESYQRALCPRSQSQQELSILWEGSPKRTDAQPTVPPDKMWRQKSLAGGV